MKTSDTIDQIAPALVKAQAAMPKIRKDSTNPHFKSSYLSLEGLLEATRPTLLQHGIVLLQSTDDGDDAGLTVTTRLLHLSGQWIEGGVRLPLEKPTPQAAGSAFSYGKRYGLEAILGLTGSDDDDGNAATVHAALTPPRQSQAAAPARRAARNGSGPVMPFGRTKGTPLADLPETDIQSALEWAVSKGKFTEFQDEARQELAQRAALVGADDPLDLDEPPFDDHYPR